MSDSLHMRRARREDLPAIVALYADDKLGATRETPDELGPYEAAFAVIDADARQELMVAELDGRIVGTLQLTYIPQLSYRGQTVAQVEAVRVASGLRNRGLGRKMMEWAIARARAAGCRRLQLTSNKSRTDAHRFYERLGFARSHEGMKLYL